MKYLKTYKEAVAVYQNHEHKSVIEDMLLELKDLEFHTTVSIQNFHNQHQSVRVHVSREKEFNWNDISGVISDVANYMKSEDYNIVEFTCKDDLEFKENPDDYEVKRIQPAHFWGVGDDGKIKSTTKDVLQFPHVTKSSVYEPGNFNQISKWMFDIKFEKKLIEVDKTRGISKLSTNEELSPSTYLSAADKLKKMGHIRRPEVLTAYAKEIQEREKNERKKRVFEEAKKLGQFQLKLVRGGGSEVKFTNCYLSLLFNDGNYHEALSEWIDGERSNFWIGIMQGVHPVSEEDSKVLEWYFGDSISGYINSYNGIIWLQDIYICLSSGSGKSEEGQKLPMTPTGQLSIEGSEFNEVYFANRREAIKFKNLIVGLFEGDIEYVQSNGKDFKEQLLGTLCENDERPVELSEFEELIDKLRVTRLNDLYRD
jgi:hypothetical protein